MEEDEYENENEVKETFYATTEKDEEIVYVDLENSNTVDYHAFDVDGESLDLTWLFNEITTQTNIDEDTFILDTLNEKVEAEDNIVNETNKYVSSIEC